jgi:hypothetical protein
VTTVVGAKAADVAIKDVKMASFMMVDYILLLCIVDTNSIRCNYCVFCMSSNGMDGCKAHDVAEMQ